MRRKPVSEIVQPAAHTNVMLQGMLRTNPKIDAATLASVKKEMAQPRVAASARISEPPGVSLPGIVDKIIPAVGHKQPEKAQIAIAGPENLHREIRIENTLQTENGDAVSLRVGSKVDVIIEAKSPAKK
jgi:hypothetical protein